MLRALILSNLYPSRREPTRGTFNLNGFGPLARLCDVRMIAPVPWWSRVRRPQEWLRTPCEGHTGIEVAFPTYWSAPGWPAMHARAMALSLAPRVGALRREFPFDVILAAWAYPDGAAAARLARAAGCPLVSMVLGSDVNDFCRHPALRRQIVSSLSQSHRVIAVSAALRDRVVELGIDPERVVVQHNGVDGARFRPRAPGPLREKLGLPADRRLVCYVGNFKPEKGVDVLVEAAARLRAPDLEDVEFLLIGGGPMESALRARVRELGLEQRVRFCGRRPHEEVPDWIAAADLLCLPSHREGCPNVVFEALASGRPVVASAVGGVPEQLARENGVLVPAGDAGALAVGLERGLRAAWQPDALRASVPCLSWDAFGRRLYDVLREAASLAPAAPGMNVQAAVRPAHGGRTTVR